MCGLSYSPLYAWRRHLRRASRTALLHDPVAFAICLALIASALIKTIAALTRARDGSSLSRLILRSSLCS